MPAETPEPPVTAFMLVKTTPEWLAMTVQERVAGLTTQVIPAIEANTTDIRSRFYDTEFYSTPVTDAWVWEADSHNLPVPHRRAARKPFSARDFEVVELLVGVENG
jgi:hypothetical protein